MIRPGLVDRGPGRRGTVEPMHASHAHPARRLVHVRAALPALAFGLALAPGVAHAGGLTLPGFGAESTGRAGASIAAVSGADALAINPAGLAKGHGTRVVVSATLIDLSLSFQRSGAYDSSDDIMAPWEGQAYGQVSDSSKPAVGLGGFQAVPVIAIASDLGGVVPGLHVAAGVFAPNAYPTRSIEDDYVIDDPTRPPPPTRYDIVKQEAAVVLPTVAVAYRVMDKLDIGARFSWGIADLKAKVFLWGLPNFGEIVDRDAIFIVEAKDNFIPAFSLGATYRVNPTIEVAAHFTSEVGVNAVGSGLSVPSRNLTIAGIPVVISPTSDTDALCATGGTGPNDLKTCVDLALPMTATVGGRYVLRDASGVERGDVELDLTWENWGGVSDDRVVVDGVVNDVLQLKESFIRHGFRDTVGARLGGSYQFAAGPGALIARGGLGYDTAAAKPGWARVDKDGTARALIAAGASYRMARFQVDVGAGLTLGGSANNDGTCNPSAANRGCSGSGSDSPIADRGGPDPVNPSIEAGMQAESPFNQGTVKTRYTMLMLGVSTWF